MRNSLLIYAVPLALVVASPLLPDSGRDSRDAPFMANLGPNVLPIAFWLTVTIFITRMLRSWSAKERPAGDPDPMHRGFEVVRDLPPLVAKAGTGELPSANLPDAPGRGREGNNRPH